MSTSTHRTGLDLPTLYSLFPPAGDMPEFEIVPADEVPPPYHGLLVHDAHMTVTVESYHGDLVDVRILARSYAKNCYARKILLALHGSGRIVQFGIVRICFDFCNDAVREEILAGQTPLGRILINHDVLRRIEPIDFLRIIPSPSMMQWFGLDRPRPTYGRLAYIHCNERPAIELLEIVAPE